MVADPIIHYLDLSRKCLLGYRGMLSFLTAHTSFLTALIFKEKCLMVITKYSGLCVYFPLYEVGTVRSDGADLPDEEPENARRTLSF